MIQPDCDNDCSNKISESMTPMIDVIFTLIAFMMLMINAPLLSVDVNLPETNQSNISISEELTQVVLNILPNKNEWKIGQGTILNEKKLITELQKLKEQHANNIQVVISTDKETYIQRFIDTVTILNGLEIKSSKIAVNQS